MPNDGRSVRRVTSRTPPRMRRGGATTRYATVAGDNEQCAVVDLSIRMPWPRQSVRARARA
eukprot:scaffold3680_cov133-Isochrysis_galbana.AAC.7